MKIQPVPASLSILLLSSCLTACSPQAASDTSTAATQQTRAPVAERVAECSSCGVVRSVTAVTQEGRTTGTGAVIGGIVGGVAGNQVGGGNGKKIATVAGVIGGAVLGNNIEQNRNTASWYEIVIDMQDGGEQTITLQDATGINPGARVSVQGSIITLRQ